jgi:hypothetical protein
MLNQEEREPEETERDGVPTHRNASSLAEESLGDVGIAEYKENFGPTVVH